MIFSCTNVRWENESGFYFCTNRRIEVQWKEKKNVFGSPSMCSDGAIDSIASLSDNLPTGPGQWETLSDFYRWESWLMSMPWRCAIRVSGDWGNERGGSKQSDAASSSFRPISDHMLLI